MQQDCYIYNAIFSSFSMTARSEYITSEQNCIILSYLQFKVNYLSHTYSYEIVTFASNCMYNEEINKIF